MLQVGLWGLLNEGFLSTACAVWRIFVGINETAGRAKASRAILLLNPAQNVSCYMTTE